MKTLWEPVLPKHEVLSSFEHIFPKFIYRNNWLPMNKIEITSIIIISDILTDWKFIKLLNISVICCFPDSTFRCPVTIYVSFDVQMSFHIYNSKLDDHDIRIYLIELEIKDTTDTAQSVDNDGQLRTKYTISVFLLWTFHFYLTTFQ